MQAECGPIFGTIRATDGRTDLQPLAWAGRGAHLCMHMHACMLTHTSTHANAACVHAMWATQKQDCKKLEGRAFECGPDVKGRRL